MKVLKIDHLGIAVPNLEEALKFFVGALGLKATGEEIVAEQKVKVVFLPTGDSEFELLESTDPEGPIAKAATTVPHGA